MSSPDHNNDDPKAKKSREEDHWEEADHATTLTLEELMKGWKARTDVEELVKKLGLNLSDPGTMELLEYVNNQKERADKAEKQTKRESA